MTNDWHKSYTASLELGLNFPDGSGKVDKNLGFFRDLGIPCDNPELEPRLVAAIVERIERDVLPVVFKEEHGSDAASDAFRQGLDGLAMEFGITSNVLMHLWSGCLAASKAISPKNYWVGPLSPWYRFNIWKCQILPTCRANPIYRRGVLAAPFFKLFRHEEITLRGVPVRTCGDPDLFAWQSLGVWS